MDFRIIIPSRILPFHFSQDRLRAMAQRLLRAESVAATWVKAASPFVAEVYALRRRIATITVAVLAGLLFVHVMFGANGMVVYKQKRTEYESLQKRIRQEQRDSEIYTKQIQGLKTDEKAIEKEAREQLHYARPGEYVYVPPTPANPPTLSNHSAKR
jgi:cell division protein FtsB